MTANKILFLFLLSHLWVDGNGQVQKKAKFINPTGSYAFNGKTTIKDGDRFGYFGEIKVKLLNNAKVAVSFFICKGAPSYNSGSFIDTLSYQNNKAVYIPSEEDSTCRITFTFISKGVTVEQHQANINFGCGFGHAVFADGFYKRTSIKTPIIEGIEENYDGTNGILPKN